MTREQVTKIERKTASRVLATIPAGRNWDDRLICAVESAMNIEWWRGYYAGIDAAREPPVFVKGDGWEHLAASQEDETTEGA